MTYMYTCKYDRSVGADDSERGSLGSLSVTSLESVKPVVAAVVADKPIVADKPVVAEAAEEVVEPDERGDNHKYTHNTHTKSQIHKYTHNTHTYENENHKYTHNTHTKSQIHKYTHNTHTYVYCACICESPNRSRSYVSTYVCKRL